MKTILVPFLLLSFWTCCAVAYIYGFGSEEEGALGTHEITGKSVPTLAEFPLSLQSRRIKQIAAGESHVFVLTADGKLFATGYNEYGQIGNGNFVSVNNFTEIDTSSVTGYAKIDQVITGARFTAIITTRGRMYTWGDNERGQLADNNSVIKARPAPIFNAKGLNVSTACAGSDYIFVLSKNGKLYGSGNKDHHQYGKLAVHKDPAAEEDITKLELIDMSPMDNGTDPIKSISCGYSHTMVLTSSGRLFVSGGLFGADDTPDEDMVYDGFTQVNVTDMLPGDKIKLIRAGKFSAFVLTEMGSVYSFGMATDFRTGHSDANGEHIEEPTEITFLSEYGSPVVDIVSGYTHTLVLFENGTVGSFGSNYDGELGIGGASYSPLPKLYLPTFRHRASLIAAGYATSYIVACPPGTIDGPLGCELCPAGQYSKASSVKCINCPAGTNSSEGASFCTPCQYGTYNDQIGSPFCLPCYPASNCPVGSTSSQMLSTYADSISNFDPYLDYKKHQAANPMFLYIRVGVIAFFILMGIFVLFGMLLCLLVLWKQNTKFAYKIQEGLRNIDNFPMRHLVTEGESPVKFRKPIGGIFTILLLLAVIMIIAVSILEVVSSNEFIKSQLAPESNLIANSYNTLVKKDMFLELTLHGFLSPRCQLSSTGVQGFTQYTLATSHNAVNHTCTVTFFCPNCELSQQEQNIDMTFNDEFAMASHISYEIKTKYYMGEYVTKGVAVPSDRSSMLRGNAVNILPISITKVLHVPLLPDYFIYGLFTKLQKTTRYSELSYSTAAFSFIDQALQAMDDKFVEKPSGLSISVSFTVNQNVQVFEEDSKVLLFDLIAKIVSLTTGITALLVVIMGRIERFQGKKAQRETIDVRFRDVLFLDPQTRTRARTLILKEQEMKEQPSDAASTPTSPPSSATQPTQ